jgi:2-polyprenyl-3-methyl-5-hydroxy-6-metoxy-1,4-benzoquinol methylase
MLAVKSEGRSMTHAYVMNERRDVYDAMPKPRATLLDVGCSRGGFCALVKREHPRVAVWGIETDPAAVLEAKGRVDVLVHGRFPDDMPADAPPFDAICFSDVLEHMIDPWAALRAAHSLLSPTGFVVASIPNIRHWTGIRQILLDGSFEYELTGLFDRTHLRFFTRSSMISMFTQTGYRIDRIVPTSVSDRIPARLFRRLSPRFGEELSALQYILVARPADHVRLPQE